MAAKRKTTQSKKKPAKSAVKRKRSSRARKQAHPLSAKQLRPVVRRRAAEFLADPNITSIGIGHKNGEEGRVCIQFTVRSKVASSRLESLGSKIIPDTIDVDGIQVETDVLERSYEPAYHVIPENLNKSNRKRRIDPVMPGVSVSHFSGTAGTLGMIVYDDHDGSACILSNWHVLHTDAGDLGDATVQPGPFDDNRTASNRVGTLVRSHLGLAGDCAVARVEDREVESEVFDLHVTPAQLATAELGDHVVKSGRTTDVTHGIVDRVDVTTKINYGGSTGEVSIGGFEIRPDPQKPARNDEISMGGDSGSVWLISDAAGNATDILVGLHFAGEGAGNTDEHALACSSAAVLKKLEVSLSPPDDLDAALESVRQGYDESFVPRNGVPIPRLTRADFNDSVRVGRSHVIPYTHFSVILSESERLPRLVAWNIDGARIRRLSRDGIPFRLDPRVDERFQTGNEAYASNKLDRGHIARRADLVWGSHAEADRANRESFFYTNIAPQHESFNRSNLRGLWGELENAVFDDIHVEDLRVSVMAGPIFRDRDIQHRGVRVPSDYWKLVAFVDSEDDTFKVRAYVLTQDDLLNDIEALELDEFRLFQVSLDELERQTGLRFRGLADHDAFEPEAIAESAVSANRSRRPVRDVATREALLR